MMNRRFIYFLSYCAVMNRAQKYPDFFENEFQQGRLPQPPKPYRSPSLMKTNEANPYVDDLALLPQRLTKADKWEEFIEDTDRLKDQYKGQVMPNWEEDVKKWQAYSRNLKEEQAPRQTQFQNMNPLGRPSLGMELYWNEGDIMKTDSKPAPQGRWQMPRNSQPQNMLDNLSGAQVLNIALKKLSASEAKSPTSDNGPELSTKSDKQEPNSKIDSEKLLEKLLPASDDFGSPVRWVAYSSRDAEDGLAKVTDPETGKNRQYVVNGTVLVPVIDHSLARLGFTARIPETTEPAVLTTDTSPLKTILNNVDLKSVDDRDWLAFETVIGQKKFDETCNSDGCQSRCQKSNCESVCQGDTCKTGCVGASCNSYCKGPGCRSMCIGVKCVATCDGMSCEASCRGAGCEATCRRFSCQYTVNGEFRIGGGTWDQHYPQYDTKLHRPPGNDYGM